MCSDDRRGAGVIAGRAEPGDDQASPRFIEQSRSSTARRSSVPCFFVAMAHLLQSLNPMRRWPSSTATGRFELNVSQRRRIDHIANVFGAIGALDDDPGMLEHRLGALAHRHLPGIELAPFAAHGHDISSGKRHSCGTRQHVDAVADAGRLHQQRAALAAEPAAGSMRRLPPP